MAFSFQQPHDVVRRAQLEPEVKRAIFASWASDASAVKNRPGWERASNSRRAVPKGETMDAIRKLGS